MRYYRIAGVVMALDGFDFDYVKMRMSEYETEKCTPDITVNYIDDEDIPAPRGKNVAVLNGYRQYYDNGDSFGIYDFLGENHGYCASIVCDKNTTEAQCRLKDISDYGGAQMHIRAFNMLGELFRYLILNNDGVVMHSSCIDYSGNGIAFSAPSGTGKSTHTGLWKKYFQNDVTIINDDSPVIKLIESKPFLCGTPWSGKTDINCNKLSPLKAIVMLQQAKENKIVKIEGEQAIFTVLEEIARPVYNDFFEKVMQHLDLILTNTPVYRLSCNISREAVETVKSELKL